MKNIYKEKIKFIEQEGYNDNMQNTTIPNFYREMFPYGEIPKILFDFHYVPENMQDDIFITDTTFRDGQQARAPYTTEQMVYLFKKLHDLGGENGIIRQTEFFVYSKQDQRGIDRCMELGYKFPEVTTWIRATKQDFELVKNMGIKETGILVSCSDYHIYKKMGMTRSQAMTQYLRIVSDCIDAGVKPRCHFEDITRADFYGFVVPFASALMEMSRESGVPIKIRACDTLGYGVPYPGAVLPRSVPSIIYGLQSYANVPSDMLEWHGHNDFYCGVSNAMTAWLYGASAVNCSLLGIGERTGNVPVEAMVFAYASLKGTLNGMNPEVITEIAEYMERKTGYSIPPMTPFVGKNFNVTKAGIHADGVMKDSEIYNIFDTEKILHKKPLVAVSNVTGRAGIACWINNFYSLTEKCQVLKGDSIVHEIYEWVKSEYEGGRVTMISDKELDNQIKKVNPKFYKKIKNVL